MRDRGLWLLFAAGALALAAMLAYPFLRPAVNMWSFAANDVEGMSIVVRRGSDQPDLIRHATRKDIETFAEAFRAARPADDGLGTTHRVGVLLHLKGDRFLAVQGGTQGFQTLVRKSGEQRNVAGDELAAWFRAQLGEEPE